MMAMESLPSDTNLATWIERRSTITSNSRLKGDMMFGYIKDPQDAVRSCATQSADCAIPDDKKPALLDHFQQLARFNHFRFLLFQKKDEYSAYTDITPTQRHLLDSLSKGLIENTAPLHDLSECTFCQHALRLRMAAFMAVEIKEDEEIADLFSPDAPLELLVLVQSIEDHIDPILKPAFTHMIKVFQGVFTPS